MFKAVNNALVHRLSELLLLIRYNMKWLWFDRNGNASNQSSFVNPLMLHNQGTSTSVVVFSSEAVRNDSCNAPLDFQ